MSWKRAIVLGVVGLLVSVAPAAAQRVEISGIFGWSLSDGVKTPDEIPILAPDGNLYNEVDLKDSFSWGFSVGVITSEQVEVGFLYNQQMSELLVKGPGAGAERVLADSNVNNYHGYVGFNFFDADATVRPYIMIGFGATSYPGFTSPAGLDVGGITQFSTTWGVGVKAYPSPNFGVRAGIQWTPTYIKSDPEGYWCDPWWGCYVVGDAQYSNQLQFNGGVVVRF
jgi:opacity protein-like surface antigen